MDWKISFVDKEKVDSQFDWDEKHVLLQNEFLEAEILLRKTNITANGWDIFKKKPFVIWLEGEILGTFSSGNRKLDGFAEEFYTKIPKSITERELDYECSMGYIGLDTLEEALSFIVFWKELINNYCEKLILAS